MPQLSRNHDSKSYKRRRRRRSLSPMLGYSYARFEMLNRTSSFLSVASLAISITGAVFTFGTLYSVVLGIPNFKKSVALAELQSAYDTPLGMKSVRCKIASSANPSKPSFVTVRVPKQFRQAVDGAIESKKPVQLELGQYWILPLGVDFKMLNINGVSDITPDGEVVLDKDA